MKLCSPNVFLNFTLTWILFKTEPQSQFYYEDKDGYMAGKCQRNILGFNFESLSIRIQL